MENSNLDTKTEDEIMASFRERFGPGDREAQGDEGSDSKRTIPLASELSIEWVEQLKAFLIRGSFHRAQRGEFLHLELAFGLNHFRVPTQMDRATIFNRLFESMRIVFLQSLKDGEIDYILSKEGVPSDSATMNQSKGE